VPVIKFVAQVIAGNYVDAIEQFYAEDASMQENQAAPRMGRDKLIAHERSAIARVQSIRTKHASIVAINGDTVVIHWIFTIVYKTGDVMTLDEITWQEWSGKSANSATSKIVRERFYYDSAQLEVS
jgi:SnoaL-like domain